MAGYIKIDRKILKWEWWSDINTYRLFTYMLIVAYWKPGYYKGREILRGSFPSSISELSRETNLTYNEIRTAINHLKSTGEITSKSYSKFTVFTVKNYDLYQSDNEQNYNQITDEITGKSQTDHELLTSKSQAINEDISIFPIIKESKKEIKEEDKNKKREKDNNTTHISTFDEDANGEHKKRCKRKQSEVKHNFGEYKHVTLTDDQLNKLFIDYGESETHEAIKFLDEYIEMKGYKAKNHNLALRKWVFRAVDEEKSKQRNRIWNHKNSDINASRQSQLDYLLNSIMEDEENEQNGGQKDYSIHDGDV